MFKTKLRIDSRKNRHEFRKSQNRCWIISPFTMHRFIFPALPFRSLFCSARLHLYDQKYIKNIEIFLQFLNRCFLCEYLLNCNLFLWSKLYFQHHYSSLQCHMIFRNHNNMLICCSRNISDYYYVENSCAAQYFCGNWDTFYFSGFTDE